MKFLYILILVFTIQFSSRAQDSTSQEKNLHTNYIGGRISARLESQSDNTSSTTQIGLRPYFGVDINKAVSAGGFVGYSYSKRISEFDGGALPDRFTLSNTMEAGLFVRNYLIGEKLKFFLHTEVSLSRLYSRTNGSRFSSEELKTTRDIIYLAASPRLSYTINRFRIIARIGGVSFTNYGDSTERESKEILANGFTLLSASFQPEFIGLSCEFLF